METSTQGWVFRAVERFACSGVVATHGYNPNSGCYVAAQVGNEYHTFYTMGAVNKFFNRRAAA